MRCLWMIGVLATATWPQLLRAADSESTPGTTAQPREAFAEQAPLAETAFAEAYYNGKEQRLREHYLPTPVEQAPPAAQPEIGAQPRPTSVEAAEAGWGTSIAQNRPLTDSETNDSTSTVCEPSLAVRGQEILVTGNWFAAFSRDGGATFQFRNPETTFPAIPNRPFCCDQVAIYVPSHDLMVWFLQYGKDATGNTVRMAVAAGDDIRQERWRFYDFTPQGVGNWANEWFDYPDLSYSNEHLFVTTNCFTIADAFARSVCLRIPLAELANYAVLNYRHFQRTDLGSLRPAQGAASAMHLGAHASTASLRVFAWPDSSTSVQDKTFSVHPWIRGGAAARCPDGRDWLGFVDGRITAAWQAGSRQGFAWTSAQGGNYPYPHVRVAVVDFAAGTVVSQPHIWNGGFAYAYPAAAVNASGQTGVCLTYGGNTLFPNPVVGVQNGASWALLTTATGTHGPDRNRWGDYQAVRPHGQSGGRFAAAQFSLSGGPTRQDVVPRIVQFDPVAVPTPSQPPSPSPSPTVRVAANDRPITLAAPEAEGAEGSCDEAHRPAVKMLTGLKFSPDVWQANQAARKQLTGVLDALAGGPEGEPAAASAVVALADAAALDDYSAIASIPDVGEYFFPIPESICEPDERRQIADTSAAPWNGNCQLVITLPGGVKARGTGWFLTPTLVVTAGHCVHEGAGGGFYPEIEVVPGMNGAVRPFGSTTVAAAKFRAAAGWVANGSVLDDYGAILLDAPFPGVSITDADALPDAELANAELTLSGYPADKPTGTQWVHAGLPTSVQPRRLSYMIDTFGGHSGSVVTAITPAGRRAVGIHNYGGCPNHCTRITADVLADLQDWTAGR